MSFCVIDLLATYYYVYTYKKWQPDKPYELIELNPLLRIFWEKLGFHLGMFVGSVLILTLNYIICKEAHWIVIVLLFILLSFAMINHVKNIGLLTQLINKYPTGHLPTKVFGNVTGNN